MSRTVTVAAGKSFFMARLLKRFSCSFIAAFGAGEKLPLLRCGPVLGAASYDLASDVGLDRRDRRHARGLRRRPADFPLILPQLISGLPSGSPRPIRSWAEYSC